MIGHAGFFWYTVIPFHLNRERPDMYIQESCSFVS